MGELLTPTHLMVIAIIAFYSSPEISCPNSVRGWAKVSADSKME